ncbi:MAG TPA: hypothetical protein VE597_00260 [Geminicoccaceae bacterium]|nr:hypothetical protein [Geminicoccaceae bacterium]
MALVEVGMQIHEAGPDLAAVLVDDFWAGLRRILARRPCRLFLAGLQRTPAALVDDCPAGLRRGLARRPQGGYPAIRDRDIDQHLLAIARQRGLDQTTPHAGVDDVQRPVPWHACPLIDLDPASLHI